MLFILHQTNCQNTFGAGFAGYLNRTFPLAKERYHAYMDVCIQSGSKSSALGTICEVPGDGFTIVHCFCPVNMGCGLAGGDWKRYSAILTKYNIHPCTNIDLVKRTYRLHVYKKQKASK